MARQMVRIEGLRELEKALAELPKATGKNVLRRTLRKAAEPMVAAAQSKAPVDSGGLRDSIQIATRLSRRQARLHRKMFKDDRASVEIFAGVSALPHAHLLEFGTGPRYHKSGKYVGQVAPHPFMRPAWDAHKRPMLDAISKELGEEIMKAAQRLARKKKTA